MFDVFFLVLVVVGWLEGKVKQEEKRHTSASAVNCAYLILVKVLYVESKVILI